MSDDQEIKKLVQENIELTRDTNKVLRSMRRSARWGVIFNIVWWLSIIGVTSAAYYYFVQPYMAQLGQAYSEGKNFQEQVQDFFSKINTR